MSTCPPRALRELKCWLVWRLLQRADEPKPRKVPFYSDGGPREHEQGSEQDRRRLTTYDAAVAAVQAGRFAGLALAVLTDSGITVLDFDRCVADGEIDPRIRSLVAGTYCEFSPSGTGLHAFFGGVLPSRKDNASPRNRVGGVRDGARLDGKFDVEFFGDSGFVTFTGLVTPDCELMGLEDTIEPLTPAVRALYEDRFGHGASLIVRGAGPEPGDADDLLRLKDTLGWSIEQARRIMAPLDPGVGYEEWSSALMALHHEFADGPHELEARELAVDWSSGAFWSAPVQNFAGRDSIYAKWRSFGKRAGSHAPITARWLLARHKDATVRESYDARAEWVQKLKTAPDEFTLREQVCKGIREDARLTDIDREALAYPVADNLKRVGTKLAIAQVRKLIAEKRRSESGSNLSAQSSELPAWLNDWVYVSNDDKFYRHDSDEWLTMQGFNAKFNRELPADEDGALMASAAWVALTNYAIPIVTRAVYLPWAEDIFDMDGVRCVNTYRKSSIPATASAYTSAGQAAVQTVLRHLRLVCNNREDVVQTFLDWLAHNVQQPGVKIRWAPLVKGIEGDGKTVLGTLLASVMGRVNVRNVSPKVLGTDFTGWAEGSAVVVLEEIKLTGHNRYDILNALKPYITNDSNEIHRKGKDGYDAINTTNYIAFTNYPDALPLTDTDRRWWIVFTTFLDSTALAAAIGPGEPRKVLADYFTQLHDAIHQYRTELRKWLLEHRISTTFNANGAAPMTDEKRIMVGMSMSDEEHAVRDALEQGAPGVTKTVFLSTYLRNAVVESGTPLDLNTSAWSSLLKRVGYTRLDKKIKWKGRSENVWVRGLKNSEPDQIRRVLLQTLPEGDSDEPESLF